MRMPVLFAPLMTALVTLPQIADAWSAPARGTAERGAMMDAMRPLAEWNLGAPVEFVVHDLRVDGRAGFASVTPQRPGGKAIDIRQTPMVRRDGMEPDYIEGVNLQALLMKEGQTWVAVHWAIGATDVWWADRRFCGQWGRVIPEVC